jgi:hypothetical protein
MPLNGSYHKQDFRLKGFKVNREDVDYINLNVNNGLDHMNINKLAAFQGNYQEI